MDIHPGPALPGVLLRHVVDSDVPFLKDLYARSRWQELDSVPWPPEAKQSFFDSQFQMQHRSYLGRPSQNVFLIVQRDGDPIGRLYLSREAGELQLVDILLGQAARGQGVGGSLLQWLQVLTREWKLECLSLHVQVQNEAARRLYERHGFEAQGIEGVHLRMNWRP